MLADQALGQSQHQAEGELGHSVLVGVGGDAHGDAVLSGRGHIHGVVADSRPGNDPELRVRVHDASRVRFRPGNHGADSLQDGEQFGLDHLPVETRIDQLEPDFAEHVHKSSLETGQRGRGNQDF